MADQAYVRALERAEFVMGGPRMKGIVVWLGNGLSAVRQLVEAFVNLVGRQYAPSVVERGFLADPTDYRAVFGSYKNVYEVDSAEPQFGGKLFRPDNLVSTVAELRAVDSNEPRISIGGLLRRFDGQTMPLYRDRHIWPAVQLTQRVSPSDAVSLLDHYRVLVEELCGMLGLATVTVRTSEMADYGKITDLVVTALPDGRPTVLATLYVLADRLRTALGDEKDIIDVGFTGKLIATCAMMQRDASGLVLPSVLAPVQVGVTAGPATDLPRLRSWLEKTAAGGVRTATHVATGVRNRAERRWHALGVPLVIGLDRGGPGDVRAVVRAPRTRSVLAGMPDLTAVRRELAGHDARLLTTGQKQFDAAMCAGRHVRNLCPDCSAGLPVFGELVPIIAVRCASCGSAHGRRLFISEPGRFY